MIYLILNGLVNYFLLKNLYNLLKINEILRGLLISWERYDAKITYLQIVEELQKLAETAREDLGDDMTKRTGKNVRPSGVLEEKM